MIADVGDETICCVVVYDDNRLAGVLVNETPTAVEWATDVFESYRRKADPVANFETV